MPSLSHPVRRLPVPLIACGVAVLVLGVVLQLRGIALPSSFAMLTGAGTAFGIMARIGGAICLVGLALAAFATVTRETPERDFPTEAEWEDDDLPPSITPAHMVEWQRRLAEKAAAQEVDTDPVARHRGIGPVLHKAAIVLVAVALAGTLAALLLEGEGAGVADAMQALLEQSALAG